MKNHKSFLLRNVITTTMTTAKIEAFIETNPFQIPEKSSTPIKKLDQEQGEHGKHGERVRDRRRLKIWETNKTERSRSEWIKALLDGADAEDEAAKKKCAEDEAMQSNRVSKIIDKIEKYITSKSNNNEKEALTDFISKKREIFLLKMSLNIKKEEIRKLDEKAKAKAQALQKSEQLLEDDALRFDNFLKENDKKAQDAIRLAEKETKRKMEKVQEIKKMNHQLQVVQSSINKHKSGLEECLRYKSFLQELTPNEWFKEQAEIKRRRQRERRQKRIEMRQLNWKKAEQEKLDLKEKRRKELDQSRKKQKGNSRRRKQELQAATSEQTLPPLPDFEDEELTSSDEDVPMYFGASNQLLDIFSALEEENLFLIQNTQEAEQSLDEMTERFEASKIEVQKKADTMQENINLIDRNIASRQMDIDKMKIRMEGKNSGSRGAEQKLMNDLTKKVKYVYERCGFKITGATPSTLFMLAEIESKMENIFLTVQKIPDQDFKRANKSKEKKRREAKRAQQQADQIKLQEERNRKAIERSMQPPKKPQGKKVSILNSVVGASVLWSISSLILYLQVMYRSYLVKKQNKKEKQTELNEDELDEIKFLT